MREYGYFLAFPTNLVSSILELNEMWINEFPRKISRVLSLWAHCMTLSFIRYPILYDKAK